MQNLSQKASIAGWASPIGKAPANLSGTVVTDEQDGQSYYIDTVYRGLHPLNRPADALALMTGASLGISNSDLEKIPDAIVGESGGGEINPITVQLDVPFTSQAPNGNWSDPMYEDGCEEASIIMAWHWATGGTLTANEAAAGIIDISRYELNLDGEYRDRSIEDTAALMRGYYDYGQVKARVNITPRDIIDELMNGNLVIIAVNGQNLGNPHYTPPGPMNHMLVVTGYDAATDEFVTNDAGTSFGQGYRYPQATVAASLRDYPTGYHGAFPDKHTAMIVVGKN